MRRLYWLVLSLVIFFSCQNHSETEIPNFKAKLFRADTIDLQAVSRHKVTLLTIWSIFCGPCLKELPELQSVYEHYKLDKRVTVLTLALNTNQELIRFSSTSDSADIYRKVFVHSGLKQLALPVLIGTNSPYQIENGSVRLSDRKAATLLKHLFKFEAVPTTRIYNQNGQLVFEQRGAETSESGLRHHRLNLMKKLDSLIIQ
ncbi:TlpA disulfide reductase family protein [Spirosoma sp.]|uniref:TlpA family protein disulfide reductase n=1 Tax=Spirosoma sp. TaxID=1899569 RepID=UPI002639DEB1|nr:TlpA disulfide reductase family protein [Spirosoma sp.]MCX6212818.1 TlpA disulfide reductase family protein [Spirosoma sp.]